MGALSRIAFVAALAVALSTGSAFATTPTPSISQTPPSVAHVDRSLQAASEGASSAAVSATASPQSEDPAATVSTDDNIPGVDLGLGTTNETLDVTTDKRDVYRIYLEAGGAVTFTLAGPQASDSILRIFSQNATDVSGLPAPVASNLSNATPKELAFKSASSQYYYLDVEAMRGSGAYSLRWSLHGAPDANIPGVLIGASPVAGWLDSAFNWDDVHRIALRAGDTLSLRLTSTTDSWSLVDLDVSLYLYGPSARNIYTSTAVAQSSTGGSAEEITYVAPVGGYYYADAYAYSGCGRTDLAWKVAPRVTPRMALTSASTLKLRLRRGTARFTLGSRLVDQFGRPLAGCATYLQISSNGRTWRNAYRVTTDSRGVSSRVVLVKKRGTVYYRWLKPATAASLAAVTRTQKVVIR